MTVWGGEVQHEKVGVNVFTDNYDTNTPTINVYADWSVESVNWGFNDGQTLNVNGSTTATFNFTFNVGGGIADQYVGRTTIYNQGQSYGGGPTYEFHGWITGQYLGGQPSVDYYWALPARPANVPTPPGISVDSVTSTSAHINVSAGDPRGAGIDNYQVAISAPNGTPSNFGTWTDSWYGGSGTTNKLTPATTYIAAAQEHNGVGWSAWAYSGNFTTGATAPGAPTGQTISNVDQMTATVAWTAPTNNGGSAVTGYDVQIATDSGFSQNVKTTAYSASPANLTGLSPSTQYYVRTRAKNSVGASAWTATGTFTTLTGTPTIVSPANGATLKDAACSVIVSAQGIASDRTITVQISQDNTFASVFKTLTLNPGGPSANNQYTLSDAATYLKTGTWYARAQVKNNTTNYVTPWSATNSWTEDHAPAAALVSPASGKEYQYTANVTLTWSFTDAAGSNDAQTAYQLVVEDNLNGTTIFDSGKVASAATSYAVPIDASLKNQQLRWKVMVWDKGDTASAWTNYFVFTLADTPVVTILTPSSGSSVDNGAPTFSWSVTIPSGGTQATAVIHVTDASSNQEVWNTTVNGTATSVTPPVVILGNQHSYTWTLDVTDSTGLSTQAVGNFTTSYQAPNSISYETDASGAELLGYILVDWTQALPDPDFASWKVYRKVADDPTAAWELLIEISDVNTRQYQDHMLVAGVAYMYSVTQVATRSGALLESTVGYYRDAADNELTENRVNDVNLLSYWIINPNDPSLSVRLPNVTSDDSTFEQEQNTYQIIGRGRHTDYGDDLGYSGSLKVEVRIPERPSSFRQKIEDLVKAKETYYLRTPFGRVFPVSLGSLQWSPKAGTGTSEMGDMTIPYEEVH